MDAIFFDVTNALTYEHNYLAICHVFEQIRREGRVTPQIAFLTNSASGQVTQRLYDAFYRKNLYPDLWFRWQNKPLILAKPEELSSELLEFFTVRQSWAWTNPNGWFGNGRGKWPWIDHHPQGYGRITSPNRTTSLTSSTREMWLPMVGQTTVLRNLDPYGS